MCPALQNASQAIRHAPQRVTRHTSAPLQLDNSQMRPERCGFYPSASDDAHQFFCQKMAVRGERLGAAAQVPDQNFEIVKGLCVRAFLMEQLYPGEMLPVQ